MKYGAGIFSCAFLFAALLTIASYKQKVKLSISNMGYMLHNDMLLKSCRMEAESPLKQLCKDCGGLEAYSRN